MLTTSLIILKFRKWSKKKHTVLPGRRPIAEIKTADEIIKEIHYSSCVSTTISKVLYVFVQLSSKCGAK